MEDLGACQITWRGMKNLAMQELLQLVSINLGKCFNNKEKNAIGSKGIKWLTKANLPHLTNLWLGTNID